ncbi:MAG: hypothetical protein Q8R67_25855 [Rhodoferax sp.]|nr:hypothetical protein [Rhodoferax sp.]MDP3655098.1 hypothetical protein [Rhodoferax sp.]
MGRDNQAKDRQLRRKAAKDVRRASYARILIVTEGSKTEPLYLEEIRAAHQLTGAGTGTGTGSEVQCPHRPRALHRPARTGHAADHATRLKIIDPTRARQVNQDLV